MLQDGDKKGKKFFIADMKNFLQHERQIPFLLFAEISKASENAASSSKA